MHIKLDRQNLYTFRNYFQLQLKKFSKKILEQVSIIDGFLVK